ncbi:MAG TPA: alpha/beta fold hydrolase [Amycolatopsis sp.]|uniref:alpha/beta hydrolase n=1 Tax=Amycolatopsis sp. TaxID=37632 RepID=UPI002B475087|nr:alpha/beta fold hydrolase [Amycolatopsis sp.]HKS47150.1 alpha/beta fold hydrolase [Amycolatopsis sp.]
MNRLRGLGFGTLSGATLLAAGITYEKVSARRDEKRFPGLGTRMDAGNLMLHARVLGTEHHQSPTVVFESGLSTPLEAWARIQPEVAKLARTLSYDRAGLGRSDAGASPRTAERINRELAQLLSNLDLPKPCVLVGHSYGGLLTRCFADRFPETVAGIVLLDSAHPDQFQRSTAQRMGLQIMRSTISQDAFWSPVGLTRILTKRRVSQQIKDLPDEHLAVATARLSSAHNFRGTRSELDGWLDHVNAETRETVVPDGCRLTVVTAGKVAASDPAHAQLQRELAGLAKGSRHEVLADAEHMQLLTHPEHASTVAKMICEMVLAIRESPTA